MPNETDQQQTTTTEKREGDLRYPLNIGQLYKDSNGNEVLRNYIKFTRTKYKNATLVDETAKRRYQSSYDLKDTITLELPDEINIPDHYGWSSGELYATSNPFRGINLGDFDSIAGALTDVKNIFANRAQAVAIDKAISMANFIQMPLGTTIDSSVVKNQFSYGLGRTIVNPNTTLLFGGGSVRNFVITTEMQPMNKDEADMIEKIISLFRQASRGKADIYGVRFPDVWRISTSSPKLDRILDLGYQGDNFYSPSGNPDPFIGATPFALTSFNPTVHTDFLYHNEYPHRITLTIEMTELKPKYIQPYWE